VSHGVLCLSVLFEVCTVAPRVAYHTEIQAVKELTQVIALFHASNMDRCAELFVKLNCANVEKHEKV